MLRQRASETEKLRRLPDATLADLHETELFRLFQPTRYGGIEAPIRAFVDIGATLGRGCGSTSWVFNNLIVHNWMLGYWPRQAQDEVWQANPRALIGSSFVFPAGKAEKTPGGYRLSGKWPFASGIDASDWMMLAAPATRSDGAASEPRFFLVPKSEYSSIDNWHVMGLAGTGSKDIVVDNIFVAEHRTLAAADGKGAPHPGSAVNPGALYRLAWYA
ncbi:MAG TPA: flavin-dependent monooxygenase, partial [Stellaceae bacterium]|nr:flavin-dependent monooxygenase [Stellaceae bacterium]